MTAQASREGGRFPWKRVALGTGGMLLITLAWSLGDIALGSNLTFLQEAPAYLAGAANVFLASFVLRHAS